jgi:hypothetical protein
MKPVFILILLSLQLLAITQDTTKLNFVYELNLVMKKYSSAQKKLMNVRGGVRRAMYLSIDAINLMGRLKSWDPNFKKVGIVLYEQENDTLNIFYTDNLSRRHKASINISKIKLQQLEQSLKRSMGAQLSLDSIGKRGLFSSLLPKDNLEASIYADSLSRLLLPKEIPFKTLDHLVIVPTNNIGALPFSMFKVDSSLFLIDKMSYSIVPSINEFIYFKQMEVKRFNKLKSTTRIFLDPSKTVLMVANPTFKDPRFVNSELPGAEKEVIAVGKHFPHITVLKNEWATKKAILKEVYDKDILYFATHGIASVKEPVFNNALFLAGKNQKEIMWTYDEIINLGVVRPLKAEIVILSACQTGLGYSRAAGIVSLARAFQISGADNVVMSLWNISDNKTPELMNLFLKYLQKDLPFQPFGAMQEAIKEFKKQNPNPVYWAPFSVYGVPN